LVLRPLTTTIGADATGGADDAGDAIPPRPE
jgi:hypothetical protein